MQRYHPLQRWLHWLVVLFAVAAFTLGQTIDSYGFEGLVAAFGQDMTNAIYTGHKSMGIIVLGLMLVRLGARLAFGRPPYATPLPAWQKGLSEAVHGLLYALLLLMPVLGWLATGAGGFPVQLFSLHLPPILPKDEALSKTFYELHGLVGSIIATLVALHVAAALWHGIVKRDGVLSRMI